MFQVFLTMVVKYGEVTKLTMLRRFISIFVKIYLVLQDVLIMSWFILKLVDFLLDLSDLYVCCSLIVQDFHRTYATGAACQQRTLTPPDTWSCPSLGLALILFYLLRPATPYTDLTLHQFVTLLPDLTFLLNLTFSKYWFHRTSATGVTCRQGTLTPPDTWSCPTLGLAWVLMSRPISPELVLSPDF